MAKVRAGQFSRARDQLELARLTTDDRDLLARIDLSLAYVDAETGDVDAGVARCQTLVANQWLSPLTRGLASAQLALIRQRTGDVDKALAAFSTAIPLLADEPAEAGRALLNRGSLHLRRGNPQAAIVDLTQADAEFGRAGLTVQRAKAEHNLGFAQLLTGDVVGALQTMDSARDVLAPLSAVSRAVCEQDRAKVLTAAGRAGDAIKALESAAAAYGSRRLRSFQAQCELTLAWSLLREDPVRARVVARRAARHFRGQASPVLATRAEAVEVVAEVGMGRRGPSLVGRADDVVAELRRHGHQREAAIVALQAARVSVRRGACGRRQRTHRQGPRHRGLPRRHPPAVARGAIRAGPGAGRSPARPRPRPRWARRPARVAVVVRQPRPPEHPRGPRASPGDAGTATRPGRRIAGARLRVVGASARPRRSGDPGAPARRRAAGGTAHRARVLYAADPAPRSADGRRLDQLRDRIREQSWYGDGSGQVGEPAALEEVQAELASTDACLVAHVAVDGWITAIVVTGTQAHTVRLCESKPVGEDLDRIAADLDMAASQLAGPFAAAIRARWTNGSRSSRPPRGSGAAAGRRPSRRARRRRASSPVRRGRCSRARRTTGHRASVRDPLAGAASIGQAPSASRGTGRGAARRAGGGRGRAGIGRLAPGYRAGGRRAVATQVADLAAKVDVLHLAGHGRHPGDNPLFSAVELADGPWFGYDIDQLPHTPATVVLSSCELGRASVRSGDEVVGMTAAWLHAGARCVISSPTLVADDVACEVLAGWHARVAKGDAPADALADAVRDLDDDAAPSPFVSFGAGW